MSRPGRPRNYDPLADEISYLIRSGKNHEAQEKLRVSGTEILDGEARTPFFWAAFSGNVPMLRWLAGNGSNVNHQDRAGLCALHVAVQEGKLEAVEELVAAGASTELRDSYGNAPLWRATFEARGEYRIVEVLLDAGANPRSKNNADTSPLGFAKRIGDAGLVALLEACSPR